MALHASLGSNIVGEHEIPTIQKLEFWTKNIDAGGRLMSGDHGRLASRRPPASSSGAHGEIYACKRYLQPIAMHTQDSPKDPNRKNKTMAFVFVKKDI